MCIYVYVNKYLERVYVQEKSNLINDYNAIIDFPDNDFFNKIKNKLSKIREDSERGSFLVCGFEVIYRFQKVNFTEGTRDIANTVAFIIPLKNRLIPYRYCLKQLVEDDYALSAELTELLIKSKQICRKGYLTKRIIRRSLAKIIKQSNMAIDEKHVFKNLTNKIILKP